MFLASKKITIFISKIHVVLTMSLWDKITTRNFLASGTGVTFLTSVIYVITQNPELLENPLVTGILGAFTTLTALVYQFYFRKSVPE